MSNLLVVIGSARVGRVADKVLGYIQKDLEGRDDVTVTVADLAQLNLPFYNNELPAMSPDHVQSDENVAVWSKLVTDADSVLFITPEYNHTLTAIEKNALDWLYNEWTDKPVTAVAYGWTGGSLAVATLREVLTHLKADVKTSMAQLAFMKDISVDGSIIDEANVTTQIAVAIDEITITSVVPAAA